MEWDIALRKNSTGEVRTIKWDEPDSESLMRFIWEEGNYACDCNRHLFFHRAAGVEPKQGFACGDEEYEILSFSPTAHTNTIDRSPER